MRIWTSISGTKTHGGFKLIDTKSMFKNRVLNEEKLLKFGFLRTGGGFYTSRSIMHGQFKAEVYISDTAEVSVKVYEAESGQEYSPAYVVGVCGSFVGEVINECEEQLRLIAENCFDYEAFKSPQAKEIIEYAYSRYNDMLEFLWDKFPNNAVLRRKDTKKWYAAFMTVEKSKLGINSGGTVEIIDMHALPEDVDIWIREKSCLPAYHMNKKHWYTICLDNSVLSDDICRKLDISYMLAK